MSQKTVQLIIGRILTDEDLRRQFLVAPCETLARLRDLGFDLTDAELDALLHTDDRLWTVGASRIDARLQQCGLRFSKAAD